MLRIIKEFAVVAALGLLFVWLLACCGCSPSVNVNGGQTHKHEVSGQQEHHHYIHGPRQSRRHPPPAPETP